MWDPSWDAAEDSMHRVGESLWCRIKAELGPTEYLLWMDRPIPPRARRIPFVPAVFAAVIAGLSGFALAALFGIAGPVWIDLRTLLLALGLAPALLGGLIAIHCVGVVVARCLRRRRLARLVYAVTDHRAIVARIEPGSDELESLSLRPGDVSDTRCFENPDGSGDLYFLGQGIDHWLPFSFFEVPRVGFVEALARETLLGSEPEWWESNPSGAY